MFTGIIEEIGTVTALERTSDAARITVEAPQAAGTARHGDSISVSGVCLTVVASTETTFRADVMAETLAMSTLSQVVTGRPVNIERAALVGDRLGGHIVQGHVDGTARLLSIVPGSAWRVLRFAIDPALAPLVVRKGSIALDGTSLTVSAVNDPTDSPTDAAAAAANPTGAHFWFEVSLIPETLSATTLGTLAVGDRVNVETDILARHIERMLQFRPVEVLS